MLHGSTMEERFNNPWSYISSAMLTVCVIVYVIKNPMCSMGPPWRSDSTTHGATSPLQCWQCVLLFTLLKTRCAPWVHHGGAIQQPMELHLLCNADSVCYCLRYQKPDVPHCRSQRLYMSVSTPHTLGMPCTCGN